MDDILFAKNLRFLRSEKEWKLADIQSEAGFSSSQWSNYENGVSFPRFEDLIKICKLFGVSETDIIHVDLSIGNLITNQANTKNKGKGNLKGNPKGNLNTRNSTLHGTKKGSGGLSESLSLLQSLMQEQQERQQSINTHLTGILAELAASNTQ